MNKIYMARAYRYGNHNAHNYILGFTRNYHLATLMCKANDMSRGGKYESEVEELEFENSDSLTYIYAIQYNEGGRDEKTINHVFDNEKSYQELKKKVENDKKLDSVYCYKSIIQHEIDLDMVIEYHENLYNANEEEEKLLRHSYERYLRNKMQEDLIIDIIDQTTDLECLYEFFKIDNTNVKLAISKKDLLDEELIRKLAEINNFDIKCNILSKEKCPKDIFDKAYNEGKILWKIANCLASSPYTPPEILDKLSNHRMDSIKEEIAVNPNSPTDTLWRMYKNVNNHSIREKIIENPNFRASASHILSKLQAVQ